MVLILTSPLLNQLNSNGDSPWFFLLVCSVPIFYRGVLGTEHVLGGAMSEILQRTLSVGVQRNMEQVVYVNVREGMPGGACFA